MKLRLLILMLLTTLTGAAQQIVDLNLPTDVCAGTDLTASINVSFGLHDTHSVVIQSQETTLGHSERIFLPDGLACGGRCTYRSPVTFTSFTPGATVTSVNDIKYVRLNIEHSFIGDVYIGIRCPSGQRASLMKKYGTGSTAYCSDSIPDNHWGWNPGNNTGGGTHFGIAFDEEDHFDKCDSTRPANAPGIGWNYCWSNNNTYSYAPGEALIYRSASTHYRNTGTYGWTDIVDSSNVAAGTNFYHPDQNFSTLIGCPLNGTWAIEVIDGYSVDNGYIFEWELSLDASLLPPMECVPTEYIVEGSGTTQLNDSLFHLQVPGSVSGDTSVAYTLRVVSSCGDTIDTVAHITVHPSPTVSDEADSCGSYTFLNHTYTHDTTVVRTIATSAGCDSLHEMRITVHPVYNNTLTDTISENQLPYTFAGHTFTRAVDDTLIADTTLHGCDSTTSITLVVYPNVETLLDTTLCLNQTPFLWNNRSYTASTVDSITFASHTGTDSTAILHLTVNPTHNTILTDTVLENNLPYSFCGMSLTESTDTSITLTNRYGCDSIVTLHLTVHHNHSYTYSQNICDDQLPYTFAGHTFHAATDTTFTLPDRHGADSTVTIQLNVNPTYHATITDTLCDNQLPYILAGHAIDTAGTTLIHPTTVAGCDSTIELHLTILPTHHTAITDTTLENYLPYRFCGILFSESTDTSIILTNRHGCDSTVTLHLTVHHNHSYTYIQNICDNQLPYTFAGHTFKATIDTTFTLPDRYGADSTVTIRLTVHPTYDTSVSDTTCDNQLPYLIADYALDTAGFYTLPLLSVHGCDSIVNLQLTIHPHHQIDIYDTICINTTYTFGDDTYSHTGDYSYHALNQYRCDSTTTLHLNILAGSLKARIHAIPEMPTTDSPYIDFYDQSTYCHHRLWSIDGAQRTERQFQYEFPLDTDSIYVTLIAYSIEGCADTTTDSFTIDRATIYIPNVFTPTQSTNTTWQPVGLQITELEIYIYNRHGLLVRHLEGVDTPWDGTDENGTDMPQGTYVYNLTYRTLHAPNRLQRRTGTILLLR